MRVLVTGSSSGIGKAVCEKYLDLGHEVFGIDNKKSSINNQNYHHYICDIKNKDELPNIEDLNIIFNNAGSQNSEDDINNNLKGTINVTEKYISSSNSLYSILFNASASARNGQEFSEYSASKAGLVGYMKNVAIRLAPKQITVNSISLGGVLTESNSIVMYDKKLWDKIMDVTPLKKWMNLDEVVDWVVFLTINNKSMSGQDLLIDNGENDLNPRFVWPDCNL